MKILILLFPLLAISSEKLTLEKYLEEVKKSNDEYRAAVINKSGLEERMYEPHLLYTPQFFINLQHYDDKRPNNLSAFLGTETINENLSFGISKQFSFGLQTSISYKIMHTSLYGLNTQILNPIAPGSNFTTRYFDTSVSLELNQPLWKNSFGRSNKWKTEAAISAVKASSLIEAFKAKSILVDAESKYWRLALAREVIKVQSLSLERAKAIRDFNLRREKLNLIDRAELLQSEAAVKAKILEYETVIDEEREARKAFNILRNIDSDKVDEELETADVKELSQKEPFKRLKDREDVLAAMEGMKAAVAQADIAADNTLPSFDLFSNLSLNGRDTNFKNSLDESFGKEQPFALIGAKLTMPLDFSLTKNIRAGYRKASQVASLNYKKKRFDQETLWNELLQKFIDAKKRLLISIELEKLQLEKLNAEKKRHKEGRSTTFQVFLFEQEYLQSQLLRIKTQGIVLGILTQMKLFN